MKQRFVYKERDAWTVPIESENPIKYNKKVASFI